MTLQPRSLQGRLLVLVLGLVVTVWLVTAARTWVDVRHELDELLDGHLAQAAALLVVQQMHEIEGREDHGLDELDSADDDAHESLDAPMLHRYAPAAAFQVFHEGRLVLRSANAPITPMMTAEQRADSGAAAGTDVYPDKPHQRPSTVKASAGGFATTRLDGVDWRVYTALGAERDVRVYVGERLESRQSILWAVLRNTLAPMALALPLLALAAWWAVYSGVAPLRRLGEKLAQRQPQSLHPVVLDGAPSEMTPMLDELNGLFARIAELMESERRFTADAAHELRTPIAAIRTQAQVALGEADFGLRRHALQATLEGCDRATRLVEQLLTLSRLEAGTTPKLGPIDLPALVRSVLSEQAIHALHKQQTLEFDAPTGDCLVNGDATLLSVLARNLIDNAVRYSPPGATIDVAITRGGSAVQLSVQDSGPGITDTDRARVGERFFRVLGSGQGGSGLGWSIVKRIAAVHGAEVRLGKSATLGGLNATVSWPAV
ncbi:MAG: two-component sensor histidine kinase [Burkholderiales bacterium]|nr:two-component sensor histidine kinase [Burkholderiales bacterium]